MRARPVQFNKPLDAPDIELLPTRQESHSPREGASVIRDWAQDNTNKTFFDVAGATSPAFALAHELVSVTGTCGDVHVNQTLRISMPLRIYRPHEHKVSLRHEKVGHRPSTTVQQYHVKMHVGI